MRKGEKVGDVVREKRKVSGHVAMVMSFRAWAFTWRDLSSDQDLACHVEEFGLLLHPG